MRSRVYSLLINLVYFENLPFSCENAASFITFTGAFFSLRTGIMKKTPRFLSLSDAEAFIMEMFSLQAAGCLLQILGSVVQSAVHSLEERLAHMIRVRQRGSSPF